MMLVDFTAQLLALPLDLVFNFVIITPLLSFVAGLLNGQYKTGRIYILPRFLTLIGIPAIVKALNGAMPKVVV
jgi:hypothetical protein